MTEAARRGIILRKLARLEIGRAAAVISTGITALDAVLGAGGLPRGRIVEWFGPPSSGKTTLALRTVGSAQRSGLVAAWIDADRTFDPVYAGALGVTLDRLPVVRPESAEEALQMARQLLDSGAVDLLIVDSAAALTPQLELEAGMAEASAGLYRRVLASLLRRLGFSLRRTGTAAVLLNQSHAHWDAAAGDTEASSGGPALKLRASVRIAFQPEGRRVRLRALKNAAGDPFATAVL